MGYPVCSFRVVHSAWRFVGRELWIFSRIVCGTVAIGGAIIGGMLGTGRLIQKPFRWMSSVKGYVVGHSWVGCCWW